MSEAPPLLSVSIGSRSIAHWSDIEIQRWLDVHPTVGLVSPFEPERKEFSELFRPFSYAPLTVEVQAGDRLSARPERLFTGSLVSVVPRTGADLRLCDVAAYSRPAKLAESDMPWEAVPFQTDNLTLKQIAVRLCEPMGIAVVVDGPEGAPFRRVRPTKRTRSKTAKVYGGAGQETLALQGNIQEFLADLARQRGLVLSSTTTGELLFQQSASPGKPVAVLEEGVAPLLTVEPSFNPQEYFSEITGIVPAKKGRKGAKFTLTNPHLTAERRSMSFELDDTEAADAPLAVRAKMGRMFGNMVSYSVRLPTWRTPGGALWAPNMTVSLLAPSAMIYRETELLVRGVTLYQNATEFGAELNLVLPGSFSAGVPDRLPWEV